MSKFVKKALIFLYFFQDKFTMLVNIKINVLKTVSRLNKKIALSSIFIISYYMSFYFDTLSEYPYPLKVRLF